MKVKTSDLIGDALDHVVLQLEAENPSNGFYSTYWDDGGPIIEREEIALEPMTDSEYGVGWLATRVEGPAICMEFGPTMLVAAMRCFVASQLGDEVEVPDELTKKVASKA
jgi:hypothetical protein